mmetsp:Transcript_14190/g.25205  ORF Transcript_14190/g.25205 Transcript_14190/m.25205 type:complete len:306 (+) Transcript_14190:1471-2388(+)
MTPTMTSYVALYDYKGNPDKDQIQLSAGDKLLVQDVLKSGWCIGNKVGSGIVGYFPKNYVKQVKNDNVQIGNVIEEKEEGQAGEQETKSQANWHAKIIKEYKGDPEKHGITVFTGEIVRVRNDQSEHWLYCEAIDDRRGYIPRSSTEISTSTCPQRAMVAKHPFKGNQDANQLSVRKGDYIGLIEKMDNGWSLVINGNNQRGYVPSTHIIFQELYVAPKAPRPRIRYQVCRTPKCTQNAFGKIYCGTCQNYIKFRERVAQYPCTEEEINSGSIFKLNTLESGQDELTERHAKVNLLNVLLSKYAS